MDDTVTYNGKTYKVRYTHERVFYPGLTGLNPRGGRTTAYIDLVFDLGRHSVGGLAAAAECSCKDVYSKKRGREIAKGRLIKILQKL